MKVQHGTPRVNASAGPAISAGAARLSAFAGRGRYSMFVAVHEKDTTAGPGSPEKPPADPRKIRIVRILAFLVVPAAFVGLVAFGLLRTAPPANLVDKAAPEFSLPLLGGGRLDSAALKGHPVVVNFWASWCLPCREEAPLLESRWQEYKQRGIKVIGVNVQDSEENAADFARELGLTFPIVRDVDLVLYRKLGVRGLPETFFVDQSYKFTAVGSGPSVGEQGGTKVLGPLKPAILDAEIEKLVSEQGKEPTGQDPNPVVGHR